MSHNSTLLDPCRDAPDVNRTANATSENYCYKSVTDPGFITGFWLDDTGTCYRNCSQICTDPKLLFSYWGTITGCLNWSPLDRVVSVEVSSQVELNRTHLIAIDLINSCMKEYCEFPDPDLGGCNYTNITDPARRAHWMDSAMFAFEETSGACDVVRTVNSDLGGPGVGAPP
jgi:hypothetical protein